MNLSWIFDTAPTALAVAAGISGGVLLLVSLVVGFARRRLHRAAETEGDVDDFLLDVVRRTSIALLVVPAVYAGSRALSLPADTSSLLRTVSPYRSSRRPRSGPPPWSTSSCGAITGGAWRATLPPSPPSRRSVSRR